jgi:para-aminobenzoate synthetase component 2
MSKLVLIDHNDSFTYNLVSLLYHVGGIKPTVISIGDLVYNDLIKYDKIVLSPGAGMPKDYTNSFKILQKFAQSKPILGVCLGHQIIAEYYGANLYNLENVVHGQSKRVSVSSSVLFNKMPDTFNVGLYHSWAVSQVDFPNELQITSFSEDKIIMSLQRQRYPVFGLQFHPESFLTENGEMIIENFLNI